MGDVVAFEGGTSEEAARERAQDKEFDFEASIHSQIATLRELCDGQSITIAINGHILTLPYSMWLDDMEKRMLAGTATLSFDEDPELGTVARVIPLKRSVKPKKPVAKTPAMRVRLEPTPEELEARRLKRKEAKARRQADRAAKLAYIENHYGKDQAEAFALLAGWR